MKIETLVLGLYETNCYIVYNEDKGAFIIDPATNADKIKESLDSHNLDLKFMVLTHAHGDHIGALAELMEAYPVPVYLHQNELTTLYDQRMSLSSLMNTNIPEKSSQLVPVEDGQEITFGQETIRFIHCPGHTPGGMSIYIKPYLFTGDTLFYGSIGRTDFPGGNYPEIIASCHKLISYPADTIILPGHGPRSLVSQEKMMNPFLA
ncbi:MBL fold metallo-hydrolase [Urinicoccus massiliensis]|uniref:MBL fold metallo-hydrolase n=1 Tax=Urinicoccus massiliensis TaxID=1723382 RepID=UPI00092FDAC8|nr:MBL fold metallo-hydrolase [Urinicoccus massiliensis]